MLKRISGYPTYAKVTAFVALLAVIVFAASSIANADEAVQKEEFTISPTVLSPDDPQNIEFVNTITTSNNGTDPINPEQPPSATRTVLDLPKQFKINNTTFP